MADGFSRKVDDILKKKLNAIDNADNRFIDGFSNIEKTIYDAVRKKVLQMNVDSGKAIFDDTNVQIINELDDIISDAIQSSNYPAKVKEYLRSFDTIKQFNFDAHQDVNDLSEAELEKLINPMQKQVVDQTIEGLTGSGISTQFTQPMKEGIFKNIVGGATITDLESYLKQFILSDELRLGQFKKYTTQIARDTLNQFDGQVNSRIAGEFGLNAYKYVGSLIDDSRPQCVRWVNKGTLLLDELPTEISWAYSNGTGMIPGTTAENFAVFRGGYNCRHSAIPFKMTKSQMEKYNRDQEQKDENESAQIDDEIESIKNEITEKQNNEFNKPKNKINTNLFATTASDKNQKDFLSIVENHNDSAEISNEYKTIIGLLNKNEQSNPSSNSNSNLWKSKPEINPKQISKISPFENGVCYQDNKQLSIALNNDEIIIGKNYSKDCFSFENEKGEKLFSMSSLTRSIDKNIATTITHEFSHLIQNKYDPNQIAFRKGDPNGRVKMKLIMSKLKIKLSDSPTQYGSINHSEFFAESLTAYVYAPEWLEKKYPKAFNLIENLLNEYGIDKSTIKQY